MFGFTSDESLFIIAPEIHNPELLKPFDEIFEIQLTKNKMDTHYESEEYKELAKEIRRFYLGEDVRVSNETLLEYNDILSDIFLVYGIDQSAKAHARYSQGKTYYYRFSVEGNLNVFKQLFKVESVPGTSHGDELCYLFRCHSIDERYNDITDDSIDMKTIRATSKLWANFAKLGKPTPNNDPIAFKPIQKDLINFVDITNEGLVPALGPHNKFMSFWKDILTRHAIFLQDLKAKDEL